MTDPARALSHRFRTVSGSRPRLVRPNGLVPTIRRWSRSSVSHAGRITHLSG
jgi:hypothetical protein